MVCKECGSYNAENLSVCKVCGAKLREEDTGDNSVETVTVSEEGKPSRDFVKPPAWPKSAFSGAPEKTVASPVGDAPAPSGSFRPTIPPRAAASVPTAVCPHCGKPALADAPFCAYCGQKLTPEPAAVSAPPRPAAKSAASQSAAVFDDDFDDDDFDDEEEEDYKPAKASKRAGKLARRDSAEELDAYGDDFDDEYDEYDEYDDEEFDDMPRKRGKGTTIIFWGLIVLLLALIAVFGMYIAKKNFDGDYGKMFASIGSIFKKDGADDVNPTETVTTVDANDQMYTATISEYTDPTTNVVFYDIDVNAPTGSTIRIITNATLEENTITVPSNNHVTLRVDRDIFMPNAPVESEIVTITPNIQVISPDGMATPIAVPDITVTVPVLSMTVTEPLADTVSATFDNKPIAIMGQVNNYDVNTKVFINDEQVYVDSTGLFTASYTPKSVAAQTAQPTSTPDVSADPNATPDPDATTDPAATPDAAETPDAALAGDGTAAVDTGTNGMETITIEARKNNCVTARKVITVEPYVTQTMSFLVGNDVASLSSEEGTVTLTGTVTPGAVITATSPSTDVSLGQATVTETGTFTLIVSIAKVGAFDVELTGTLPGYYDGSASVIVERPPSVSSTTFKKTCADLSKNFDKIVAGTTTSGDFVFTGRVTEIIATEPYTIFRVQISEGVEVIVVNRSAKSTINSADVKEKKQIAGTLKGLYSDGTTPYVWGWFIWNK